MISYKRVRFVFDYHKDGYLVWRFSKGSRSIKGEIAGSIGKRGYHEIRLGGKLYKTHRLIFLWHHGYLPELVDHKDRVKTHNWIDNLREASKQCNARNCKIHSTNTSGIIGVSYLKSKQKWRSRIIFNGNEIYLGVFETLSDAVMARWRKEVELNWNGCNETSSAYLYLKENNILPRKNILKIKRAM